MSHLTELKDKIRTALPELDVVIAWGESFDPMRATPLFIYEEKDLDKMVWGPECVHNTATYLTGLKDKKVGVVVKGCDSRSIVQLLQEGLIERENLVIFGAPCAGVMDLSKVRAKLGELGRIEAFGADGDSLSITSAGQAHTLKLAEVAADKCAVCRYHNALVVDHFVGDPLPPTVEHDDYADVAAFESLSVDERFDHWQREMERCIRCYACRNACPMCVCRDHCIAQSRDPHWLSAADDTREKWMFQLIHAMHLAGRCTECGECQRVCPVDIPLLTLKRKLGQVTRDLFVYEAGTNPDAQPPLSTFQVEEENINERGW